MPQQPHVLPSLPRANAATHLNQMATLSFRPSYEPNIRRVLPTKPLVLRSPPPIFLASSNPSHSRGGGGTKKTPWLPWFRRIHRNQIVRKTQDPAASWWYHPTILRWRTRSQTSAPRQTSMSRRRSPRSAPTRAWSKRAGEKGWGGTGPRWPAGSGYRRYGARKACSRIGLIARSSTGRSSPKAWCQPGKLWSRSAVGRAQARGG